MLVHILEFSFSGIKNVEKKMKFNFYKKDIDNFSRENYNIKSVYGPNGVGKTAFIDALRMMKEVSLNRNYLIENRSLISELINKNTKCIELEIIFYYEKNIGVAFDNDYRSRFPIGLYKNWLSKRQG